MQNKFLIVTLTILLLFLIGGGVGIYYLLQKPSSQDNSGVVKKQVNPADETLSEVGPLYPLEPFTINLKNADQKDVYLKVTLSLELDSKLLENELNAKNAVIRNQIIMILSSETIEDISSDAGKVKVCNSIKRKLNAMLTDGQIRNVYIVNFTVQ